MSFHGGVVLDASAAMAWLLREGPLHIEARIDDLMSDGFVLVPELWYVEMANALRSALRAGRVDEQFVAEVTGQLEHLDIRTDVVGASVKRLALEAHAHGLTSYDACYLLLASDRGLPLATVDRDLARAAVEAGVALAL